jgi:hypothetical protein
LCCLSLLGALAGVMVSGPHAGACDCGVPTWRLTLRTQAADGAAASDARSWPTEARLEAYAGTVVLWSEDLASATIDYLHAGEP